MRLFTPACFLLAAILWTGHAAAQQSDAGRRSQDAERREILALIFRRELRATEDGGPAVALVGPNVNPLWIPEVTGVSIRQLGYGEVTQVREYYDLTNFERRGKWGSVGLLRGNYCKKVGMLYNFRREGGGWLIEPAGFIESTTAGSSCPGCETGSGARYSVRALARSPAEKVAAGKTQAPAPLTLTGRVLAARCRRYEPREAECSVDLRLEFRNTSAAPLIILRPEGDFELWQGATSLALSEADSRAYTYVYSRSAWPSIYHFPKYRRLAELLDQPSPPQDVIRVLRPAEGSAWETSVTFRVGEVNSCHGAVGVEIGWDELKRLAAPLWLRVSYEMWPFNVENFRPGLGGKLRSRWARYGVLYLEEKSGGRWFAHVTSEPIELDMRGVSLE